MGQANGVSIMRLIRLKEVMRITGLARSTIYKFIRTQSFPTPVPLGGRAVAWVDGEVQEWIATRVSQR